MSQEIYSKYYRLYNIFILTFCFVELITNVIHHNIRAFIVMFIFLYSIILTDLLNLNLKIKILFICSFIYVLINNIFNYYTNSSAVFGFLPFIFIIASTYRNKDTLVFVGLIIIFYFSIPSITRFFKIESFQVCSFKVFFNTLFSVFSVSFIAIFLKEKIELFKKSIFVENSTTNDGLQNLETSLLMQLKYKEIFSETEKLLSKNNLHLKNEINVKIIAEKLNVTPLTISKAINFCTKDNFKTYINKKRIEFVKESFEKDLNKFTIQHIYSKAGFEQQSTFNRVFKEIVGLNPKEYILSKKVKN